jgi:ribosomal protein S18 acetylase RimI-like enzyme
MNARRYRAADEESVVDFSLEAWAPVFVSMRDTVGDAVFRVLYHDWRAEQDQAVRDALSNEQNATWVATDNGTVVGFVSATVHNDALRDGKAGQILMLAVDPQHQRAGIGLHLTQIAIDWLRDEDAKIAVVETGGDPGHAPARATYERAQFTSLPIARYFQVL